MNQIKDQRGFFARLFCEKEFKERNLNFKWVNINNSLSNQVGTLRGLHMQTEPMQEVKLIRCIKGAIWDVAVDLRRDSSTFGQWEGIELNDENRLMFYVPKGFAHGFITLREKTEIVYLNSEFYAPESEITLLWSDPLVNIHWPFTPKIISEKDKKGLSLEFIKNH